MAARLSKWGPLAGVLSALLIIVSFVSGNSTLARHVRRGDRWIAAGALGGAACAAIGLTAIVGFEMVLATNTKNLTPASAQTLNLLQNDFFLPTVLGFGLFGVLGGLAVVAGRILPGLIRQAAATQARRNPRSPTASVLSMNWSTAPVSGNCLTGGSVIASRSAAVKRPAPMTW
jgi:hypothetical protein